VNYISIKNIISQIKEYLENSPVIENGLIKIEYLIDELGNPCEYSIEPVAEKPIVQKYVDNTLLRQFGSVSSFRTQNLSQKAC
jgi:hypothetical protein